MRQTRETPAKEKGRLRAPPALRHAAATAWAWRWWTQLSVAVQRATALPGAGRAWPAASRAAADAPALSSCWTSLTLRGPACCRSERERSLSAASSRLKTMPSTRVEEDASKRSRSQRWKQPAIAKRGVKCEDGMSLRVMTPKPSSLPVPGAAAP